MTLATLRRSVGTARTLLRSVANLGYDHVRVLPPVEAPGVAGRAVSRQLARVAGRERPALPPPSRGGPGQAARPAAGLRRGEALGGLRRAGGYRRDEGD